MRNIPVLHYSSLPVRHRTSARTYDFEVMTADPAHSVSLTRLIRLDRLLLLLDTGSSPSVRSTAAKQLAQLAVKSVVADIAEDVNSTARHNVQVQDDQAWSELLAVVARVGPWISKQSRLTTP